MVFVLGSPVSYHTINVLFNMQMSTEQVSLVSKELDEQSIIKKDASESLGGSSTLLSIILVVVMLSK